MSKRYKRGGKNTGIIVGIALAAIMLIFGLTWQQLDTLHQTNKPFFAGILIIIVVVAWVIMVWLVNRQIK